MVGYSVGRWRTSPTALRSYRSSSLFSVTNLRSNPSVKTKMAEYSAGRWRTSPTAPRSYRSSSLFSVTNLRSISSVKTLNVYLASNIFVVLCFKLLSVHMYPSNFHKSFETWTPSTEYEKLSPQATVCPRESWQFLYWHDSKSSRKTPTVRESVAWLGTVYSAFGLRSCPLVSQRKVHLCF